MDCTACAVSRDEALGRESRDIDLHRSGVVSNGVLVGEAVAVPVDMLGRICG
jgi:hypothetical protein